MPFIEDCLVYLFNTSLAKSQLPDPWKLARVSPIFRDGDKTEQSNHRQTSVLPVSKLFEKLVFNQLYRYLNDNYFINSNQSGFRPWPNDSIFHSIFYSTKIAGKIEPFGQLVQ